MAGFDFKLTNDDFVLQVAAGIHVGISVINIMGRRNNMSSGTTVRDIAEGFNSEYTGQPVNAVETLEVFSSSNDDADGGIGARKIRISGLIDGDGNKADDVEVVLNGTTPVSLGSKAYYRAYKMDVIEAGSEGFNQGNITLRQTTTTSNVMSYIKEGKNSSNIAAYTVPKGFTLFVAGMHVRLSRTSGSAGSAEIRFLHRPFGSTYRMLRNPDITNSQNYDMVSLETPLKFEEREDILFRTTDVSDSGTNIVVEYEGILVNNSRLKP